MKTTINRNGHTFTGGMHDFKNCATCNFRNFTIEHARYSKKMFAVHCRSDYPAGFATYEMILAGKFTTRYSHREHAYIMTKNQVKNFVKAYSQWKYTGAHHAI